MNPRVDIAIRFFFYFEGSSPWKIRPLPVNNAKVGKYKRQQERKRMESEIIIREKSKSVTFYLLKSLLLFSSILINLTNALRK